MEQCPSCGHLPGSHAFGCRFGLAHSRNWPEPKAWKCKAHRSADPPQDCNWPLCGCDPYADKVIEALSESGAFIDGVKSAVAAKLKVVDVTQLAQKARELVDGMRKRTGRDPDVADFAAAFEQIL